jgi:acyl-CoA synthetase (AMP-forming)/AMP-acid ligase II
MRRVRSLEELTGGKAATLWNCWRGHADRAPDREAIVHWAAGQPPFRWTWGELVSAAADHAQRLLERGVKPGDVCALIMRHHRSFYPLYMAVSALGALPSVLAYPNPRLHPEKFRAGLEGMALRSGLDWVLSDRQLEPITGPLLSRPGSTVRGLLFPLEWSGGGLAKTMAPAWGDVDPDAPCLLQHSSGTTGLQKAVVLSHRAVLEHVRRYAAAIEVRRDDRVVSWLPLYHDMGLMACFQLPLALGIPLVQLDPFEWIQAPYLLIEAISGEGGSLVWLPNFAYNLMADRIHEEDLAGMRLESLRLAINCSEPVRAESHDKFYRRFAGYGLRREALAACYAMAETTFAATQTPPGGEARSLRVDRDAIARGRVVLTEAVESTRVCVSSGLPIPGCRLRAVADSGQTLPEDSVGELVIQSESLFDGYRNNPEQTAEALRDGWYYSGDYGFVHANEWYVVGRKKDIIIVAGKNVYPEDVEDAVSQVPQVLPGRVIAFGLEDDLSGTEKVLVVAETPLAGAAARRRLCRTIREAGMAVDVTISHVCLAPPRWLIKSSAGKASRHANKARALRDLALE